MLKNTFYHINPGQFAATLERTPATWKEALADAVWSCHRRGVSIEPHQKATGTARWDGRWHWATGHRKLARCIARSVDPGAPDPEPGTLVDLRVLRSQ